MKETTKPSTVEKHPDVIAWEKFKDKCKDYFRVDTITHQRYLENRIEDAFYHGISHGESKPSTVIGERSLQECKDQVAKDHGFESWWHVLSKRLYRLEEVDVLITEAAELYASQFKKYLN